MENFTTKCIICGEEFSAENPCWNSYASYEDGTHSQGECKMCAKFGLAWKQKGEMFAETRSAAEELSREN